MSYTKLVLLFALSAHSLYAQQTHSAEEPKEALTSKIVLTTANASVQMTKIEMLAINATITAAMLEIMSSRGVQDVKIEIEKNHPGYILDLQSRQLVPIAKQPN